MPPSAMRIKISEYKGEIPFHIQEEIMKRLLVKSLIQFRSVSKAWKSLIDNSHFIAAQTLLSHTQPHHLLVSYEDQIDEANYVCYNDDETFPQQKYRPTIPLSVKQLKLPRVVGSSHGLLCFYGSDPNFTTKMVVLWNPSIRKSIVVAMPAHSCVGFRVCPVTHDPKIVSITQSFRNEADIESKVMVYTLSWGKWRSLSTSLPSIPLRDECAKVVTDGFIYWCGGLPGHSMIMSFDVTNENFEMIDLPDSLARLDPECLFLSKLCDSLVILEDRGGIFTVWVMEHAVQRSFTQLFITTQELDEFIVGFRKNGLPIMQLTGGGAFDDSDDDDAELTKLVTYEHDSKDSTILEISESDCEFNVISYMETLLLLGQSDCNGY